MKNLSDDELDQLFRDKLLDLENNPLQKGWPLLAKDLKRQNFLTFGWKHFNLYQLIAGAMLIIGGALYLFSPEPIHSNSDSNNTIAPKKLPVVLDSIHEQKIITSEQIPVSAATKETEKKPTIKKKEILKKNLTASDSSLLPNPISIETPSEPSIQEIKQEEPKVPKPKKIITILKRDTLVIKDTVSVKKKRKSK